MRRLVSAVLHGPMSRNLGAAIGVQLCLLVGGTLSARLLGPQNRGYLAILVAWPSAIGQLGAVGMSLAATYFLSARLVDGTELLAILRRSAVIQIVALTLINVAIVSAYVAISGTPIVTAAILSFALLPGTLLLDYGVAFLLGARRHGAVTAVRLLNGALYAGGMVLFYVLDERSISAVVCLASATAVVAGLFALATGVRAARQVKSPASLVAEVGLPKARRQLLRFGRKGYVGYLSPVDSFRIDQLVVGFLVSPRALGLYVVGASFTNFTRLVAMNVGLSSTSEVASVQGDYEKIRAVRRTLLLAAAVLTTITLALALLVIPAIPILFGARFRSALPVAEILFVAGWLLSMKRVAVDALRGAGEARAGTRAELVNLGVFLIACAPLAKLWGGPGVALALVIATASGSVMLIRRLHQLGVWQIGSPQTSHPTRPAAAKVHAARTEGPSSGPSRGGSLMLPRALLDKVLHRAIQPAFLVSLASAALAVAIGLRAGSLYGVLIGLITLAPVIAHVRHVGCNNAITEPSPIPPILAFYVLFFPLRAIVVSNSHFADLVLRRLPITNTALVSLLLLTSAGMTLFVESYYLTRKWRPTIAEKPRGRDTQYAGVIRLAYVLSGLSVLALAIIILQHGGIAGTRAQTLSHSGLEAIQGKSQGAASSVWGLFAGPTVWACAYAALIPIASRRTRVFAVAVAVLIIFAQLYLYGSRLQVVLALIGVWVVYYYSGRRLRARWLVLGLVIGILASQPVISSRGSDSTAGLTRIEHYSRITGYGVLDVSLAIHRQPQAVRAVLTRVSRWTETPAYFVPSFFWHGRPNLNTQSLNYATSQYLGASNQLGTGLPSTYFTEAWLIGGTLGVLIWSVIFGAGLGWVTRRLVGEGTHPSPGAILAYAFVVSISWNYFKDGDIVTTVVGQARLAVYLAGLLWVLRIWGHSRHTSSRADVPRPFVELRSSRSASPPLTFHR